MPINTKNKEYLANSQKWAVVRDCEEGASAVKAKRDKYLPKPGGSEARYDDYLMRANFVNYTAATVNGLLGMVFREDAEIDLQPDLEYLLTDANGNGLTLDQQTRRVVRDLIVTGRMGLLVDFPAVEPGASRADTAGLRANIVLYPTERIINWREKTLVVLEEEHEVHIDEYASECRTYHRVLRLEDGQYVSELYDDKDVLIAYAEPRMSNGARWTEIPFIFAGAENNDQNVDKPPLYDLAEVNIAHYRNSADFEESSYMVGQPTPWISGLTQHWIEEVLQGQIMLGSKAVIFLPDGAQADLLQATDNQMPERGMAAKEAQMIKLGARLIEDTKTNESATGAAIRFGGQTSVLATIVGNAEAAMLKCINWAGMFMGATGDNVFQLNREFYDREANPQTIMAAIQLLDRGVIAMSDLRGNLRASGMLDNDRTDDEIDGEAEQNVLDTGL